MIKINDVTKKYNENVVLEHINYSSPQKGIVCLVGPSGGGKTTLFNLLAGFDSDYQGKITVGGKILGEMDVDTLCAYRRDNVGFIFQNYYLISCYTVLENVTLGAHLTNDSKKDNIKKATELLKRLGIFEKANQKVEDLSGGQKQRVAIARALMGNPQIIFADEPTGALDRKTSTEIMMLLSEISKDRLVILITHDRKICDFADEIIEIKDKQIMVEKSSSLNYKDETTLVINKVVTPSSFKISTQNFKVHFNRYLAVSLAISIGILAFLFSLSFGNVMEKSINDFKEKNTAFNNGYIKGSDDGKILKHLTNDERIENVYYQYKLNNISLSDSTKTEIIKEKIPMPKANEGLSYGVMPRFNKNEIAITPSLAKKFDNNIKNLLGKNITLKFEGKSYLLTISGIYNAGYDDFFVSSDVEQILYSTISKQDNYSISYDVKNFSDIVGVSNSLKLGGLSPQSATNEVYSLQNTFRSLNKLFLIISILILIIALFICSILLIKLQNTRYREVGLMSALGFRQKHIASIIRYENVLLSTLATIINIILLGISMIASTVFNLSLIVTVVEVVLSVVATFAIVTLLSSVASYKLIRTEPAVALRK